VAGWNDRTDTTMITPRKRPCASCPYRRDVPSGVWEAHEYDKLCGYDGDTAAQAMAGAFEAFFCHAKDGHLCAGWVGCHDMHENLAIRLRGDLDYDTILNYRSPVPLFTSGAEAAAHGKRDIASPGPAARRKIGQLVRARSQTHKRGDTMTTTYTAVFDRVGRTHDVAPLKVAVPNHLLDQDDGAAADFIAESVHQYVRRKLVSRDVEVIVDLDNRRGQIFCGFQDGGTFTINSAIASQAEDKE